MLSRDQTLKNNWGTICTPVEMIAADGRKRKIQASDTQYHPQKQSHLNFG